MAQFEGIWDGAPTTEPNDPNVILDADHGQIVLIDPAHNKKVILNAGQKKTSEHLDKSKERAQETSAVYGSGDAFGWGFIGGRYWYATGDPEFVGVPCGVAGVWPETAGKEDEPGCGVLGRAWNRVGVVGMSDRSQGVSGRK